MSKIKVHAGDWGESQALLAGSMLSFPKKGSSWSVEQVPLSKLAEVDVASEDSVKRVGGTVGWGAVGALALGPVGLLAGLLLGGRGKNVTFVANFKDGRKMLATTDNKTYTKLKATVF